MIKANAHKYSVSAMCKVLKISRSTYYYEAKQKADESELTVALIDIFKTSRNNYGTRKIKRELAKRDMIVSRRRIGRIMKQEFANSGERFPPCGVPTIESSYSSSIMIPLTRYFLTIEIISPSLIVLPIMVISCYRAHYNKLIFHFSGKIKEVLA